MPPSGHRLYCSLTSTNKYVHVRVLINTLQYGHHLYTITGFIIYNPIFIYLFTFNYYLYGVWFFLITLAIAREFVFRSPDCGIFIWFFEEHLMHRYTHVIHTL